MKNILHIKGKKYSKRRLLFTLLTFFIFYINFTIYIIFIIHSYIIDHYYPSIKIIDLVSNTTYVVCVNFIHKWQDLQFKVDSERLNSWETFSWQISLLSEFLPEICWEEIAEEILFVIGFHVWPGPLPTRLRRLIFIISTINGYILLYTLITFFTSLH